MSFEECLIKATAVAVCRCEVDKPWDLDLARVSELEAEFKDAIEKLEPYKGSLRDEVKPNELANAKGKTLVTEPPEFESAGSPNAAGWVFIAFIFSLVFYALYKRGRRTSAGSTSRRFHYGRFGWR